MPDIISNSSDLRYARLSNLTKRAFWFRKILCNSIEGVLQALKCADTERQKEMCLLWGKEAQQSGKTFNWPKDRYLYWQGKKIYRGSEEYEALIEEIFIAAYYGDSSFAKDLRATGHEHLTHTIRNTHQYQTVLTGNDFLANLRALRDRAHREEEQRLNRIVCDSLK